MNSNRTNLKILISAGTLVVTLVLTIQLIVHARQNQELKTDLSQINHIRYGLLNADEWSDQVSGILAKKILEFEITPENREEILSSLSVILYRLIDEVESMMIERTAGQFSGVKRWMAGFALNLDQLRDSVPSFSNQVLEELKKPETELILKEYLNEKLENLTVAQYNKDQVDFLEGLLQKYGASNKSDCREIIKTELETKKVAINNRMIPILVFVLLIYMLNTISRVSPNRMQSILLILSSFLLLLGGITTPMIDLEARIDILLFQLLGEDLVFRDNIIFFQSKSITDVVSVLMKEGSIEMIFVGILIFVFSIIFPSAKLISSFIYTQDIGNLKENILIRFFVMKSGKWSMADVMVVAIFMAYVGFNGIIGSQLDILRESSEPVEIFTTNGTRLLGGFYLFLFFCLSSLVLSEVLTRKYPSRDS